MAPRAGVTDLWLLPLGGLLLSLAFPNELIPGTFGAHPPAVWPG